MIDIKVMRDASCERQDGEKRRRAGALQNARTDKVLATAPLCSGMCCEPGRLAVHGEEVLVGVIPSVLRYFKKKDGGYLMKAPDFNTQAPRGKEPMGWRSLPAGRNFARKREKSKVIDENRVLS